MDVDEDALACPACAAPLEPDDASRARGALRCRFCGAWRRLRGATTPDASRVVVDRPRSIHVEETPRGVRIVRRWFSVVFVLLVVFCAIWDSILLAFFHAIHRSHAPLLFALVPILHVAVGVGLTYFTLAGLVNRTTVELDEGRSLVVRHGPLPWPGGVTLDPSEIAQLFVVSRPRRDESRPAAYTLAASMKDGRRVRLLRTTATSLEEALFLEQEVERRLRIRDVPVVGEALRGL